MRRPKNYWGPYEDHELTRGPEQTKSMNVDESDNRPEWSGLYDADGKRLYRPKTRFGFEI